jgi:hypothetical protein
MPQPDLQGEEPGAIRPYSLFFWDCGEGEIAAALLALSSAALRTRLRLALKSRPATLIEPRWRVKFVRIKK